ncbi:type II toxin-antitoxin system VapC family toxin [Crocosphaera sp. XPORK-15E]|uniref:type II toxin-antitoxin system VapC family toxin n=1 Tax=Crocosphaera sp. XPORK-15E TaxID=3110247 RepID=UPI002B1F050D|nr:type II toxin-antitoxin system VapC family toxin [Crocosphaera sp. XPORK-15E]MEA5533746.1 type II toxin-antitoxin system VapC family toxin [Crocosphaera sp. XPORK-15E]
MNQIVVDANVAIKWVLPEIYSEQALRLRNSNYNFCVPDFFFPEIGNILWKRVRRGEMSLEDAQSDLAAISSFPLQICPSFSLMPMALMTAIRVNQAVYDCVYLALAVTNQCQMVTADERFFNAVRNDFLFDHLMWVEDIP